MFGLLYVHCFVFVRSIVARKLRGREINESRGIVILNWVGIKVSFKRVRRCGCCDAGSGHRTLNGECNSPSPFACCTNLHWPRKRPFTTGFDFFPVRTFLQISVGYYSKTARYTEKLSTVFIVSEKFVKIVEILTL